MKKLVLLAATAVTGYAVWIKVQQDREERDLWAEVTDSFEEYPAFDRPEDSGRA